MLTFRTLCFTLFVVLLTAGSSATPIPSIVVDGRMKSVPLNAENCLVYFSNTVLDTSTLASVVFEKPRIDENGVFQTQILNTHIYIKFAIENYSDSTNWTFFYGHYFKNQQLYLKKGDSFVDQFAKVDNFIDITVPKNTKDTVIVYAQKLSSLHIYFEPQLVAKSYVNEYLLLKKFANVGFELLNYIVVAVLYMMFMLAFANFITSFKKEYLFYSLFTLGIGSTMLVQNYFFGVSNNFMNFYREHLEYIIIHVCSIFYCLFYYFSFKGTSSFKKVRGVLIFNTSLFVISGIAYILLIGTIMGPVPSLIYKIIILSLLMICNLYVIWRSFPIRDKTIRYIVSGNGVLLVFVMAAVLLGKKIAVSSLYINLGFLTEMFFFIVALTHKNRQDLISKNRVKANENVEEQNILVQKEIAGLRAQQDERNRISADMHDELGGSITAIRLMSELVKQRMDNEHVAEIEKISASADELIDKINAMVWSMNANHDYLPYTVAYIRSYLISVFDHSDINLHIDMLNELPMVKVAGIKRRNLFFSVKEIAQLIKKRRRGSTLSIAMEYIEDVHEVNVIFKGEEINSIPLAYSLKNRLAAVDGYLDIPEDRNDKIILVMPI